MNLLTKKSYIVSIIGVIYQLSFIENVTSKPVVVTELKPAVELKPIIYMVDPAPRSAFELSDFNYDNNKDFLQYPFNKKDAQGHKKKPCLEMHASIYKFGLYRDDGIILTVKTFDNKKISDYAVDPSNEDIDIVVSFYNPKDITQSYTLASKKSKNPVSLSYISNTNVYEFQIKIPKEDIPTKCPFENKDLGKDCHLILRFQYNMNKEDHDDCSDVVLY